MGYRIEYAVRGGTMQARVSGRSSLGHAARIARNPVVDIAMGMPVVPVIVVVVMVVIMIVVVAVTMIVGMLVGMIVRMAVAMRMRMLGIVRH